MSGDEKVQAYCRRFKLCRGCRFVGNECVVRDEEVSIFTSDGKFNDRFKMRMTALILTEISGDTV